MTLFISSAQVSHAPSMPLATRGAVEKGAMAVCALRGRDAVEIEKTAFGHWMSHLQTDPCFPMLAQRGESVVSHSFTFPQLGDTNSS